jgi:hypothetical protein
VYVHRDLELPPQLLGKPDVIRVRMGEHDRLDVALRTLELTQALAQLRAVGRKRRVDDSDALVVGDEVPVDDRRPLFAGRAR